MCGTPIARVTGYACLHEGSRLATILGRGLGDVGVVGSVDVGVGGAGNVGIGVGGVVI